MKFQYLSESEIKDLYTKYIEKPHTYHRRLLQAEDFESLELASFWSAKGKDVSRIFSILDFQDWIQKYKIQPHRLLFTCEFDPELYFLPNHIDMKTYIPYEGDGNGYDLHVLHLDEKNYDFVLVSQTLEHVYNPGKMMETIWNHMAPGGYFFTSVPTVNIPHNTPIHFQHFFPIGLVTLAIQHNFEVVEVGYWGNKEYILKMFDTVSWPDIYQLRSLENDPHHPVACWCLLRKPIKQEDL